MPKLWIYFYIEGVFERFLSRKNQTKSNLKEFFLDLKVFFFDLNVGMVATIAALWYLPQGCYGTYHTSVVVGTIM